MNFVYGFIAGAMTLFVALHMIATRRAQQRGTNSIEHVGENVVAIKRSEGEKNVI